MAVTVGEILSLLNEIAPLERAEEWDNVGLLVGSAASEVENALCALNLNDAVVDEAVAKNARLIVTHHPVMFVGRKNLREDNPEGRALCKLVRAGIALIAMHTNFDSAHPGVNDALAARLGLADVSPVGNYMCVGTVEAMSAEEFRGRVEARLGGVARRYGSGTIRRVAVMGGDGGDFFETALECGADAFVTGEIGYHKALDAAALGLCVLEAGHGETEKPAVSWLADALQKALDGVQYDVRVLNSTV